MKTIEPVVWNWWRQGMMGGAKAAEVCELAERLAKLEEQLAAKG